MNASRSRTPRLLADLTYEEAAGFASRLPYVLLPVGATEAHGPHLPLSTDVLISKELAYRVQRVLEDRGDVALIAPSLDYAVTEFGAPFAGTVSLRPETAQALYVDVFTGLVRAGFARVCVVNSHLEAAHVGALRAACIEAEARSGHKVAFPDHTEKRFARMLTEEYKRGNCHAGRYETSLILGANPEVVRQDQVQLLSDNPNDFLAAVRAGAKDFPGAGGQRAYFGSPRAATQKEGEEIYQTLLTIVLTTLDETFPRQQ